MRAAEEGLLLLCCRLPGQDEKPLTLAQLRELGKRARAFGLADGDPLRDVAAADLRRLGYAEDEARRITALLGREEALRAYLRAAEARGIFPVTRLDARFPARLRQSLGALCPAVLFARGDASLLAARCVSVVGSRALTASGRAFAEQAGRMIAEAGLALASGGAAGADTAAQRACLSAGGRAVVFPAGSLLECEARAGVLYLAEQAYDQPFSAQRALARNRLIHAMGEKVLVAQCTCGRGGTWEGATENLRRGYSPVFVHDDGSDGANALIARGACPVKTPGPIDALQPMQLHF